VPVGAGGRWKIARSGPAGHGAATREPQAQEGAAGKEPQQLVLAKLSKCSGHTSGPYTHMKEGVRMAPQGSVNCQWQVMLFVHGSRKCS